MSRVRLALLGALAISALLPRIGACQTAPTTPPPPTTQTAPTTPPTPTAPTDQTDQTDAWTDKTFEFQLGMAGVTLPEQSNGLYSAEVELRVGWFLRQSLEVQGQADLRAWPLGATAAKSYGGVANLLWFPRLGSDHHDFYFLAGAGGAYTDPPDPALESGFDPLVRAGIGVKAPLEGLSHSMESLFLNAEFRGQLTFADETDFLSGISVGVSRFR